MDPPLINESSFSSANPSSYSLAGIWPLTSEVNISGSSDNHGRQPEFEQGDCARKRKGSTSSHILVQFLHKIIHLPNEWSKWMIYFFYVEQTSSTSSKRGKMDDKSRETKNTKGEQISKKLDPHKDYIHVRARRGQATDSHSLAERVRPDLISLWSQMDLVHCMV